MAGAGVVEVRRLGRVPYREALALQERLVGLRRSGEIADQLLLLEHPHVITLGSSSEPSNILADEARRLALGVEVAEVGRGGDVTYHGPGQLVAYPILTLRDDRRDLHRYLRDLEEVVLETLATFGVHGERIPSRTGVWTSKGKVAAIGVRVSSGWITSHGFALNVSTDLDYFETIVPCGLDDRRVTSLDRLVDRPPTMDTVQGAVADAFARVFGVSTRSAQGVPG